MMVLATSMTTQMVYSNALTAVIRSGGAINSKVIEQSAKKVIIQRGIILLMDVGSY